MTLRQTASQHPCLQAASPSRSLQDFRNVMANGEKSPATRATGRDDQLVRERARRTYDDNVGGIHGANHQCRRLFMFDAF